MLEYLMKSHNLLQTDLADIFGGQANVSKFLNGKRPLSKNQSNAEFSRRSKNFKRKTRWIAVSFFSSEKLENTFSS